MGESLRRQKGLTLPVLASSTLGSGFGFGDAASELLRFKWNGRGEIGDKKKNILKLVSFSLRCYSQNLVTDRFSSCSLLFRTSSLYCCQLEFQAWHVDTREAIGC